MLSMESDAAAALRVEVENELKNKKQCCYQPYECTQLSVDGYNYCLKHILQDKCAPFKQCQYVYSSNQKRCYLPAPRTDKKDYGYCNEHALKTTLERNKQNVKNPPPHTAEVLLDSLSHYIKKPRYRTTSSSTQYSEDDRGSTDDVSDLKVTKYQDVFADLDASQIYNEQCNKVLDFCSESESDVEPSTLTTIWHDAQADSSDDESIDSESEDPLKHANVYTAEEICMINRDKLVRLQSLYVEQYRHLQYLLKEKRRKYLHALKREKETCCNIYNQVRDNPKEQRLYKKLKALNNYHRVHGVDAILSKRLRDLRSKLVDGTITKQQPIAKCSFTEGGVKCGEKPLPLTRHCRKHILEDTNQVLFKACGKVNGDIECTTPVAAIFEDSTCPLHKDVPPLRSYSQIRKDSESDMDESGEAQVQYHPQFSDNIKTEFMNYDIPPDIPKMETLPSMLFEESSQSMMSDSQLDVTSNVQDNNSQLDVTSNVQDNNSQLDVTSDVQDNNGQLDVTSNVQDNNSQLDVTSNVPLNDSENTDSKEVDSIEKTESLIQEVEEKIDIMETVEEMVVDENIKKEQIHEESVEAVESIKCKDTPEEESELIENQESSETEQNLVKSDQNVGEIELNVVETEQHVVETEQHVVETEQHVVKTEQHVEYQDATEKHEVDVEQNATENSEEVIEYVAEKEEVDDKGEEMEVQLAEPEQALDDRMEVQPEPEVKTEDNFSPAETVEHRKEDLVAEKDNELTTQLDSEMKQVEATTEEEMS